MAPGYLIRFYFSTKTPDLFFELKLTPSNGFKSKTKRHADTACISNHQSSGTTYNMTKPTFLWTQITFAHFKIHLEWHETIQICSTLPNISQRHISSEAGHLYGCSYRFLNWARLLASYSAYRQTLKLHCFFHLAFDRKTNKHIFQNVKLFL